MTIRAMLWICAVGLTSGSLAACGSPASLSQEQADDLRAARADAAEASEELTELRGSLAQLERRFEKLEGSADRGMTTSGHLRNRLDSLSERLRDGLSDIRAAVEEAESASSSASSNASSALSEVRGAVQDLSVLRARYDEHLRRFHGGG